MPPANPLDPVEFRDTLGRFPTGVVIVASTGPEGSPVGMTVGSFTSVSLDPPLVAFLPAKTSSSFPAIREGGKFCVNVLAAQQQNVCRMFARSGADKFAGVAWEPTQATRSPRIKGVVAWIDCEIETIHDAGDHYIVIGRVQELAAGDDPEPLLFFQGGYGGFRSPSLTASAETGLLRELHYVDMAQEPMRRLAEESGMQCLAFARRSDWQMMIGSAGPKAAGHWMVGRRQPHRAPLGGLFEAWASRESIARWAGVDSVAEIPEVIDEILDRIRQRGWSLGLGSGPQRDLMVAVTGLSLDHPTQEQEAAIRQAVENLETAHTEPSRSEDEEMEVRSISAPVFDQDRNVVLVLAMFSFRRMTGRAVSGLAERVSKEAEQITEMIGGQHPDNWQPRFHL